jgi:hypothetical protein
MPPAIRVVYLSAAYLRLTLSTDVSDGPFSGIGPTIVSAFADNELSVLHTITKEINELVAVLAEAKGEHCDLRMNAADRRLMTFPDRHT